MMMMLHRYRSYLQIILYLPIIWIGTRLLMNFRFDNAGDVPVKNSRKSINKADVIGVVSTFSVPFAPDYMRILLACLENPSLETILFHQFDTKSKDVSLTAISKSDHDKEAQESATINTRLDKIVKLEGDKLFSFNLLASNRIGSSRRLPDTRHRNCPRVEIESTKDRHDEMPTGSDLKASIIICYYNEAPSALLRTINSVILRSPVNLTEEIIIVDDFSQYDYSSDHIKAYIIPTVIKIKATRTSKREGLIRARLHGASLAEGKVLIFLDSHVEANLGWLEPLMLAVKTDPTTLAVPIIDLINAETMVYSASPMVKGGLNWALNFKWDSVPSENLRTPEDFIKPIDSPTMAGGLYAIRRDYFYHIGAYDQQMELWGGENIEMSLRVWMCGGRIKIYPCSRLGHIFRKIRPYGPEPNQPDSLLVNSYRTAQVWLDEHIERYYEHYPHAKQLDVGDVAERLSLRQNLNCHNFTWFLENVYPQMGAA